MKTKQGYDGLLPLYKPRGITSHDCVARLRRLIHFRKIGHTGTLDPEADGVLVLCLGKATKIARYLLDFKKSYRGVIFLGKATTTEDQTGTVTDVRPLERPLSRQRVEETFAGFTGAIDQRVPLYSAVKVGGKKLYEYARAGMPVERPVRTVRIYRLQLNGGADYFSSTIPFTVTCSKGTYVRTLAVDIGQSLGYPAYLQSLTRIAAGPFTIDECLTFKQIEAALASGRFTDCLQPLERGLSLMETWQVDDQLAQRISHGAVLSTPAGCPETCFAVVDRRGRYLAIYGRLRSEPQWIKPQKVLVDQYESSD
ncbi:MAG: tRNA pseudouridine(55) synthase TruB [Sporolactobacillus sp.]|nr:tRNA pseudouridine(55) synthase TruB [Sporolactobacillus sp.]MCI1883021.1 tRNA pseudouridine(55) synthase TruB [Sporolactobacillus sp.]